MENDLDLMTTRMEARQARLKLERKLKKTVIKQEETGSCTVTKETETIVTEETESKVKTEGVETVATIKNEPQKTTVGSKLTGKGQKGQ